MGSIFLKFTPDVKGESIDKDHKDEIELLSFSYGMTHPGHALTGSGASGGQTFFSEIQCAKMMDKSTATLLQKAAGGQHFEEVKIVCYKAGGPETRVKYLTITLKDAIITSYSTGGQDGGGVGMESFSMSYAEIKQEYKLQSDTGEEGAGSEYGWNTRKNQAA
jgi:type VI secretion system secreted protein Hcp